MCCTVTVLPLIFFLCFVFLAINTVYDRVYAQSKHWLSLPILHNIISVLFNLKFDRLDDAIGILEHLVSMREEKLGTANPDVDDERRRLAELLREAGRVRNRKTISLVALLDTNPEIINDNGIMVL